MKVQKKLCIGEKVNRQLFLISILSMIATMLIAGLIFYNNFDTQAKNNLKASARTIAKSYTSSGNIDELKDFSENGFQIALVTNDGEILFESNSDKQYTESYNNWKEIQEVIQKGSSEVFKRTQVQSSNRLFGNIFAGNTYYYAVKVLNEQIIIVSTDFSGVFEILYNSIPIILVLIIIITLISAYISELFTKNMIKPIVEMARNVDDIDKNVPYTELEPFAKAIKSQQLKKNENERMRREFTANVSHELKTPLTSISGYAEMIKTGMAKQEDILNFAEKIYTESDRLVTLIGDIIQLSELEEINYSKEFCEVDLYKIADKTIKQLSIHAKRASVSMNLEGYSSYVFGNKDMLGELIYNLCDNAIRYNIKGGNVTVNVGKTKDELILLSIKDTGIGISDEHIERIFERFYRVDRSRSKETGGTGLGLAIVKHIALQHKAKINVTSEKDKGTCIDITFDSYKE